MSVLCVIDDKHVPLYRIIWIAAVPHFCGSVECQQEGQYEIRLEQNETLWANHEERVAALDALEAWCKAEPADNDPEE